MIIAAMTPLDRPLDEVLPIAASTETMPGIISAFWLFWANLMSDFLNPLLVWIVLMLRRSESLLHLPFRVDKVTYTAREEKKNGHNTVR